MVIRATVAPTAPSPREFAGETAAGRRSAGEPAHRPRLAGSPHGGRSTLGCRGAPGAAQSSDGRARGPWRAAVGRSYSPSSCAPGGATATELPRARRPDSILRTSRRRCRRSFRASRSRFGIRACLAIEAAYRAWGRDVPSTTHGRPGFCFARRSTGHVRPYRRYDARRSTGYPHPHHERHPRCPAHLKPRSSEPGRGSGWPAGAWWGSAC